MIPAVTYDAVCEQLMSSFASGRYHSDKIDEQVRMVGLLFAPLRAPLARAEIIPRLNQFHYRSGSHIDFFCAGYGGYIFPGWLPDDAVEVTDEVPEGPKDWTYSEQWFNNFRSEIEDKAGGRWHYSGEVDLILADAVVRPQAAQAHINFQAFLVIDLERAKNDGAIETVAKFFENVFRYAESPKSASAFAGFATVAGSKALGAALGDWFLSMLPKETGKIWKRGRHFVVKIA
jgi:hypothetical protein